VRGLGVKFPFTYSTYSVLLGFPKFSFSLEVSVDMTYSFAIFGMWWLEQIANVYGF
tara:strand:+ start:948 stop:1115 length:168 start_codon:yes stop_codon:yes gene_type:complete